MKRLIVGALGLIAVAIAIWAGWWFIGAEGQRSALEMWLEKQRQRGWQAEASSIEMTGFPGAFQMQATEIQLADPRNGWSWHAPSLLAESSAAAPTRIEVTWPDTQTLGLLDDRLTILAKPLTTLLDLRPGHSMALREAKTGSANLVVKARSGWTGAAKAIDLNIAERPDGTGPDNSYDLRGNASGVKLPKELLDDIDPTGLLKPSIDQVTLVGHAAFDQPLDRLTIEEGQLAMRAATIREAGFAWGDMTLLINGSFKVDNRGYPVGKINVEAKEWRRIVELAISSGVIDETTGEAIEGAVKLVTAFSGGGEDLSIPLALKGGEVRIGPFAIAKAPRLAPPR